MRDSRKKKLKLMQDLSEFVLHQREQYYDSKTQKPHVVNLELKKPEASFKKIRGIGFNNLSADILNSFVTFLLQLINYIKNRKIRMDETWVLELFW